MNKKSYISGHLPIRGALFGIVMLTPFVMVSDRAHSAEVVYDNTLYYFSTTGFDKITVNTTASYATSPLQGFGVYMHVNGVNKYNLKEIVLNTTGSGADAIRTNSEAVFFYADKLTISATGSSSDGINIASDYNNNYDNLVYVGGYANIGVRQGVAVRANNFQNAGANSVIVLPGNSIIKVTGTGTASNSSDSVGYAVYAGNRDRDTNGLGLSAILQGQNNNTLGNSYVFVGNNSTIETSTRNGHAVYANKGGLVQLGDGASITTTGLGAYALYASTEQQGTYTNNVRPGYIYLEGGATLRATNSNIVMRASGAGSIISNQYMTGPVVSDPTSYSNATRVNLSKAATQASSGVFDVVGIMDAISGGEISLNMADGSYFLGSTNVHLEAAVASAINLEMSGADSRWFIDADSTLTALNLNSGANLKPYRSADEATSYTIEGNVFSSGGIIDLNGGSTADTLTIKGNYVGNNGNIILNTHLDTDGSPSDRLIIDGGRASGTTSLTILNAGGAGAETFADGIMVIDTANGGTTATGAFMLNSRVAAGAYEYSLYRGGSASADNWYLRSTIQIVTPGPEPVNPNVNLDPDPVPSGVIAVPNYRSEVPMMASVTPIAMEYGYAMLDTLHERVGEVYIKPLTPSYEEHVVRGKNQVVRVPVALMDQTKWVSSGWARLIGDRGFRDNDNFERRGPDYDYTFAGIQAGLDVYGHEQVDGTLDKAGFYIGYGNIDANVKGAWRGKAGSIDMDAYTIGAYWTHKASQGWYTDAVLQSTWYSAEAKSVDGQKMKPDGFGIIASLEGGYAFNLGNGFTIEPQAQLAYQNLSFDDVSDAYGRFNLSDEESLRGRLGVRLAKEWNVAGEAHPRLVSTWLRTNVWHEFMGDATTTVSGLNGVYSTSVTSSLGGTWGEIGAGVSGQVSDAVALFATGAYNRSLDNKGREAWDGRLGVTVKW